MAFSNSPIGWQDKHNTYTRRVDTLNGSVLSFVFFNFMFYVSLCPSHLCFSLLFTISLPISVAFSLYARFFFFLLRLLLYLSEYGPPSLPPSLPRSPTPSLPPTPRLFPSFIPPAFSHLTHSIYSFDLPSTLFITHRRRMFLHFLGLAPCKCHANADVCLCRISAPLFSLRPPALPSSARLLSASPPPQTGRRTGRHRQSSFKYGIRLNPLCVTLKGPLPR